MLPPPAPSFLLRLSKVADRCEEGGARKSLLAALEALATRHPSLDYDEVIRMIRRLLLLMGSREQKEEPGIAELLVLVDACLPRENVVCSRRPLMWKEEDAYAVIDYLVRYALAQLDDVKDIAADDCQILCAVIALMDRFVLSWPAAEFSLAHVTHFYIQTYSRDELVKLVEPFYELARALERGKAIWPDCANARRLVCDALSLLDETYIDGKKPEAERKEPEIEKPVVDEGEDEKMFFQMLKRPPRKQRRRPTPAASR